jgi:hypothetical protein
MRFDRRLRFAKFSAGIIKVGQPRLRLLQRLLGEFFANRGEVSRLVRQDVALRKLVRRPKNLWLGMSSRTFIDIFPTFSLAIIAGSDLFSQRN